MCVNTVGLEETMLVTGRGASPLEGIDAGELLAIDLVAGVFIAEMCADVVDLEETMLVTTGQGTPPFNGVDLGDLPIDPHGLVRRGALMLTLLVARRLLAKLMSVSAMDVALGLVDGLPLDLFTGGIERYLRDALREPGRTYDFSGLPREHHVTVADLDRNDERAGANNPAPIEPCAARWGCAPARSICGVRSALRSGRGVDPPRPQDDP